MVEETLYDQCKLFGSNRCTHAKDDVMKRANQLTPRYYGGKIPMMLPVPTDEEIDDLCRGCSAFTPK